MNQRKIKVFLGAFINSTNAQNLNCLALARHLDKSQFEVYALELYSGNLESQRGIIPGLRIFHCFRPFLISKYLGFLWGIWHCDVAYLPKSEMSAWVCFLLKIFRKKSFKTVEGIYDQENLKSAVEVFGSYENFIKSFLCHTQVFSITEYLGNYNRTNHGINSEPNPLYLGCETELFMNDIIRSGEMRSIAYIGRLKKRKGIYDIVELARVFPTIDFLIFGNGEERENLLRLIKLEKLNNLLLKGVLPHLKLSKELEKIDLHILPSRSEGFPKVTLETAAAGVPSIVYADYGASEWITHGKDGFVVDSFSEIVEAVKFLISHPEKLKDVSENSILLARRFDWKVVIKDWEKVIFDIYHAD